MEKNTYLNKVLFLSLFLFLYTASSFGQSPIGKPGKAGDAEIDGNFIAGDCPTPSVCTATGLDWRSFFVVDPNHSPYVTKTAAVGFNAKWIVDGNSGSGSTIAETEVFRGTSNKNGDFIGAGQSPYLIETSSPSAPQKNDITNVYARATVIGTGNAAQQWVMLGAETRSVDGTSYLDFEYNKKGAHITNSNLIGDGTEGGRTARNGSVAGDVLFVVDFSKGGNSPIAKIFEWRATGKTKPAYDWFELDLSNFANSVFIVTNGADVETLGYNSGFAGDGTPSGTTLALQFVEIGVNLTALGLNDNVCSPSATLTCKTRTSSSYTSELKDFSLFQFSIVPAATLTNISSQTACPGTGVDASFSSKAEGPGASGNNIAWYKVSGQTETLIVDDNTKYDIAVGQDGLTSTLTIHNVAEADEGTYRAKLSGATCGSPQKDATLTVKTPAALTDLSSQSKCPGEDATFSTNVSGDGASAANVQWFFGNSTTPLSNDGTNYVITVSGTTSTLTVKAVAESDEGSYKAKLTGADCGSPEKTEQLTVKSKPDQKDGTIQPITCTDASFKLVISSPEIGATYTVTQPCGTTSYSSTGTAQQDGSILFTGLEFAKGYKIVASSGDGCVAEPVLCGTDCSSQTVANPIRTQDQEITLKRQARTNVLAAPNPFSDRIRFTIKSEVTGRGSLELYNTLGQKVKTVFQGQVNAGQVQTIEYAVPGPQRAGLIYIFRVGNDQTTGKLIGLKD